MVVELGTRFSGCRTLGILVLVFQVAGGQDWDSMGPGTGSVNWWVKLISELMPVQWWT